MSISAKEYMEYCTPITASCVNDGVPMAGFFKGKNLVGFGCGMCGVYVTINNKREHDLSMIHE